MSEWDAFPVADQGGSWDAFPKVAPITADNLVRSAAGGVPILGGLLNKANAATNAALAPYVDPLLPDSFQKLPETTFEQRYQHAIAIQNAKDKKFETEHPIASTAASIAGGVGATIPLAATSIGARALGITGGGLPSQVGAGLASGAGINAADALVRGQDPIAAGAVGGILGAAAPPAARLVGAAVEPVMNTIRGIANPAEEAARRVAMAADRDIRMGGHGLTPQEFVTARDAGQPVNLMDVGGETTRALARSAANTSPEGRDILNRAINDRFEGQSGRLTDWLRSTFHYPDAAAQQAALENVGRTVNRANYQRAMQEGSGGLWSPELERLAGSDAVVGAMQKAASSAKDEAIVGGYGAMNPRITFTPDGRMQFNRGPNGAPTYPDLQYWDLVRRELSDAAIRAGRGTSEARRLNSFATSLNGELDRLVPSYAQARAGAAHFFGAQDALEAGQNFVTSRMGNQEARAALGRMGPQERQLFQDGFVSRFVEQIREQGDRRSVLNTIANSPASRERLNIALGPTRAAELEGMLRTEGVMDLARPAVQGNSTTARQLAELGLAGGANMLSGGGAPSLDPTSLMNAALVYGAARGRHVVDQRVARQVAQLLTSRDPTALARGMRLLGQRNNYLSMLRHADVGLARAGASQVNQ